MSRKPRLSIGPAVPEGTAFDGAFAAPSARADAPPDLEAAATEAPEAIPTARTPANNKASAKRAKPKSPAPTPVRRPEAPALGDDAYEQTVQGNWNVPAWMRAKVRAAAEESGASQNDFVQEALAQHIEATEQGRGGGFALESRHFGKARGGR